MKKLILFLVSFLCTFLNIFGEDTSNKEHTVYIDLFPMVNGIVSGGIGLGIGYEHSLGQYFGIGGEFLFVSNFNDVFSYNIIMNGKFYPIQTKIGNLFIDAGLGYRRRKSNFDGANDDIHCLVGVAHTGWKFILGKGFVLEPGFGIRYDFITFSGDEAFKFGLNILLKIGWTF